MRSDISASYLSLIESGKKEPSLPLLREIAASLDLSLDVLMLTAIDYDEIRNQQKGVAELFAQMLGALVTE